MRESSPIISYGVFGALPFMALAANVASLAVCGLVCISLYVGLWILPFIVAFVWVDGCICVGRMLSLVILVFPSFWYILWGIIFLVRAFLAV